MHVDFDLAMTKNKNGNETEFRVGNTENAT